MDFLRVFAFLLVGLGALFNAGSASAQCTSCWGILDEGPTRCTGCNAYYDLEFCTRGCQCGNCLSHGGSGLCCGHIYYSPVIYPLPDDCGGECGLARVHPRTHVSRNGQEGKHSEELRQGYSPGLILLAPGVTYREPLFAYDFNHCRHSFGLLAE
jgi:hypothetical protein